MSQGQEPQDLLDVELSDKALDDNVLVREELNAALEAALASASNEPDENLFEQDDNLWTEVLED